MNQPIRCVALTVLLFALAAAQAGEPARHYAATAGGSTPAADAKSAPAASREARDAEKRALDLLLAETLSNPMSAIQYRVTSRVLPCTDLVAAPRNQGLADQACLCYSVNTRGENNGYQGQKFAAAVLETTKDGSPVAKSLISATDINRLATICSAADWEKRPSKLIHQEVN
jgi:hypothetical protein